MAVVVALVAAVVSQAVTSTIQQVAGIAKATAVPGKATEAWDARIRVLLPRWLGQALWVLPQKARRQTRRNCS